MRRTIAAVLMALLLAIAIQFIWGVAVAWGVGLRDTLLPPVAGDYHWIQENIELLHDGTPAVQTYTDVGGWTFRTIDRRPVAKADFDVPSPPKLAGPLHPGTRGSKDLRRWLLRMRSFLVRQEGIAETWYAVSDPDGSTRFVAFDAFSRGIIGYLGRDGFSTSPPLPGKRFSVPRSFLTTWTPEGSLSDHELSVPYNPLCDASPILLPLKDEVVVIDLRKRTIVPIWKGAPIDAEWYAFPGYDTDEDRNQFSRNKFDVAVIRTPTRLHAVFLDRKEACDVDIPELLRDKSFSVYRVSSRGLTLIAEMPSPSPSYVAWLTVEGPLRILEVPLDNTNSITCDRWPMIGFKIPQPA
ncbi:MAG TPA: hypothetical protein VHR72_01685, partial [Gemmataceae bacterium]|nr:hypothetical protein [Gemmataceae bacterium]